MENSLRVKINIKGGILPIGDLEFIIKTANNFGVKSLFVGERETLNFVAHGRTREDLRNSFLVKGFDLEIDEDYFPNIVSSYPAEDIFSSNTWLSEGIYQDVLSSISFRPKTKINIVDTNQGLIPLFTGNLNFISSSQPNFWFLYIKLPEKKTLFRWPSLIYSTEIGRLAKLLDEKIWNDDDLDLNQLASKINRENRFIYSEIGDEPQFPKTSFPNYEGLNRIGDKYWLGIYRRDNQFSLNFLKLVCELCMETKIGIVCLTTWNSLIIKGITEQSKQKWEKLLGANGINMRHSSLELNWQIPDNDKSALKLKRYLVDVFDNEDVQTNGLGFTIKTRPVDLAGSIIVERKGRINLGNFQLLPIYNILYAKNFNPNSQEYQVYAVDIGKRELPVHLMQLCKTYYQQLGKEEARIIPVKSEADSPSFSESVFQCLDCLTIYLEKWGDPINSVPPNTPFIDLPVNYCCPVCEGSKDRYQERVLNIAG